MKTSVVLRTASSKKHFKYSETGF